MEMKTGNLGLKIPIHNTTKYSQLNMDPDSIKKWRALLPMADTGAAAKKLFFALNELNQINLAPESRFEILELMRPPLQLICHSLKRHYINQSTALTKQKLTIANLAQTLQLEMVNGYKTIIEDTYADKKETTKEITALAIYRVMNYYTAILFQCYQLYSKELPGAWQELHLLYQHAKNENFLECKIKGLSSITENATTILASYTHLLSLAASNPFQWRQNEQEIINAVLDLWVPYAVLRSYSEADQEKPSLYIIDLTKDLPPKPLGLKQIEPSKTCIILSLEKSCTHLNKIFAEINANETKARLIHSNDPEYNISITTFLRLINSWNSIVTRKYKRFVVSGKMQVIFGLSAAHHYIGEEKPFNLNNKNSKASFDTAETLELTETPFLNEDPSTEHINLETSDNNDSSTFKPKAAEEKFMIYDCSLVDISPAGSCLIWENDNCHLVQPGEIIAMRTSENINDSLKSAPWSIGVIRWLKHTNNNKLKIGTQLLAPYATPAGAQVFKNETPVGCFLRCLILPQMEDLNPKPTIITPKLPFKLDKFINLYSTEDEPTTKVKLTKQIDASSSYRQFEYSTKETINVTIKAIDTKANTQALKIDKTKIKNDDRENDQFNSIWDEL